MNSPQPLSALQRGAIELLTPFFCPQEKGDGGMSSWIFKIFFVSINNHKFLSRK
jgi:hypothetical protein